MLPKVLIGLAAAIVVSSVGVYVALPNDGASSGSSTCPIQAIFGSGETGCCSHAKTPTPPAADHACCSEIPEPVVQTPAAKVEDPATKLEAK